MFKRKFWRQFSKAKTLPVNTNGTQHNKNVNSYFQIKKKLKSIGTVFMENAIFFKVNIFLYIYGTFACLI